MTSLRIGVADDTDIVRFATERTRDETSRQSYLAAAMRATTRLCAYDEQGALGLLIAHESALHVEIIDLFVQPSARNSGIGTALLGDLLPEASHWFGTAGLDASSQAFSATCGASESAIVHVLAGEIPKDDRLLADIGIDGEFQARPLIPGHRDAMHDLDRIAGGRRDGWLYDLRDEQGAGITLWRGNECVGYAYFDSTGQIGPLRVSSPSYTAPMLAYCMHTLRSMLGVTWARLNAPAANNRALRMALSCGMRLDRSFVRASNRSLGELATYVGFLPFAF
ncbi:MAG: GNAT family N-acetyltransferase [Vulcanimicrobiaceae bacterium]